MIGTMNTADRSIQLLDTALRRRFTFVEMMPDPEHEDICRDIDGIDCTKLLKAVNQRVAALLDREHQIGHTYLLDVDTIEKLSETMRNRIFPLLQEYFFDDWTKIWAVFGPQCIHQGQKSRKPVLGSGIARRIQRYSRAIAGRRFSVGGARAVSQDLHRWCDG